MDDKPTIEQLWALLQHQASQIEEQQKKYARLQEELGTLKPHAERASRNGPLNTSVASGLVSRASLLKAAAAGVVGLAAVDVVDVKGMAAKAPEGTHAPWFVADFAGFSTGFFTNAGFTTGGSFEGTGIGVGGVSTRGSGPGVAAKNVSGESSAIAISGVCTYLPAGHPGEETVLTDGTGVLGETAGGIGVHGRSRVTQARNPSLGHGTGVRGDSGSGDGVRGHSKSGTGVYGASEKYIGVAGSSASTGGYGVYGGNTVNGSGVVGRSYNGLGGVLGSGIGVEGESSSGIGVNGKSKSGIGITGVSDSTMA